jgi:hypothetical protein
MDPAFREGKQIEKDQVIIDIDRRRVIPHDTPVSHRE